MRYLRRAGFSRLCTGFIFLTSGYAHGASLINVSAPSSVMAGEEVLIRVTPAEKAQEVIVSFGDQERAFPLFFYPEGTPKDYVLGEEIPADEKARRLVIDVPEKRTSPLYVWLHARSPIVETVSKKGDQTVARSFVYSNRGAAGGLGGGGAGGTGSPEGKIAEFSGSAGIAHTGSGGGGGGMEVGAPYTRYSGYAGGSGVVIVRSSEIDAQGGEVSSLGKDKIYTFYENGTLEVTHGGTARVLVVAGGGGGGRGPGGGGGGGAVIEKTIELQPGALTVQVGKGGAPGENGEDSIVGDIVAQGGGAGGDRVSPGNVGGSGGGGGGSNRQDADINAGKARSENGNAGGAGHYHRSHAEAGGGGGGAGTPGMEGNTQTGSLGGAGVSSDISGIETYYAGGGGGGRRVRASQNIEWMLVAEISPQSEVSTMEFIIPVEASGFIKKGLLTANGDFQPNEETEPNFRWFTNNSSVGVHTLHLSAREKKSDRTQEVTLTVEVTDPNPIPESRLAEGEQVEYVDFKEHANIPMYANDPALHVLGQELKDEKVLSVAGFEFPLQQEGPAFVAIARGSEEEEKVAEVPQAEDLLRVIPAMLPASKTIPVDIRGKYIGFLHGVRGAGMLLNELFQYEIEYEDGEKVTIPVQEGVRVAGHLMDYFLKEGVMAHTSLIDGSSVNVYFTQWENPRPEVRIVGIKMSASTRILAVLLGIASYNNDIHPVVEAAPSGDLNITANFAVSVRDYRHGLFSTNAPEGGKNPSYYDLLSQINFPTIRMWNALPLMKEDFHRGFDPERDIADEELRRTRPRFVDMLETYEEKYREYKKNVSSPIFFTIIRKPYLTNAEGKRVDEFVYDGDVLEASLDWHLDLLTHVYKHHQLPITHIAIYNEVGIGRNEQVRQDQYRFYIALSKRIKEKYPELKVGGMSECWPDHNIIGEFLQVCGEYTDFISWQMYATGDVNTPFAELMQRTDRFARFSQRVAEYNDRVLPGKRLPQVLSEYNMNYRAWRPNDLRLHDGHSTIWTMSVLRHLLYSGEVDLAHFWHFTGRVYGMVRHEFPAGEKVRPTGVLFHVMNNRLGEGTRLALVNSSDPTQVEALAAMTDTEYVFIITNKSEREITVKAELLNYAPKDSGDEFGRLTERWKIQPEDKDFQISRVRNPLQQPELTLAPFEMQMFFIPKGG